jgi:putative glutamine amidotransferase
LSGGDDIGVYPRRDNTEIIALKYALNNNIPIIAICRGLQLVHTYFEGTLERGNTDFIELHRAQKHQMLIDGVEREVNSYHTNYLIEKTVAEEFEVYARTKNDNSIEGFRNKQILAMMWHPERDKSVVDWNKELIEKFLKYGN